MFFAQINTSDAVTIALIIGGVQAVIALGDRLWKRPHDIVKQPLECAYQHAELKSATIRTQNELGVKVDALLDNSSTLRENQVRIIDRLTIPHQ